MPIMRETVRRKLIQSAVASGQVAAAADLHKILDRRYRVLKRELRRAGFNRNALGKTLARTGSLFKADDDSWESWINGFPVDAKSALSHVVFGVYDTEGKYWQSRGQRLDPLDPDGIFAAYEARTGRQIKGIAEDTKTNVLSDIVDWYNSNKSLPELIDQLGQYFSEDRARLIARTESQFITSQIALEAMNQFGIDLWNFDLTPHPGGKYPCAECIDYAAQNPHKRGDQMPPLHPGCDDGIVYVRSDE